MKIRNDIYSKAGNHEKQEILQGLANLAFQTLGGLFSSKDDVIEYINNFENAEIAEQFIEVADFYHFAKFYYCPNCSSASRIECCPKCEKPFEMPASLVLIMIISIAERLSLNRKVGSVTKTTKFFKDELTKDEKIEFVKSIRYSKKVPVLPPRRMINLDGKTIEEATKDFKHLKKMFEEEKQIFFKTDEDVKNYVKNNNFQMTRQALPVCFDEEQYWECYSRDASGRPYGYCHFDYHCRLISDKELLDECFKKTVKTIYNWRSMFVHNARLPPIRENIMLGDIYKGKPIMVELTTSKLKQVFETMIKRFFDKRQKKIK